MIASFDDHKFNDDLLLQDADQRLAEKKYPSIFHVLDYPELRQLFCEYEAPANRAKSTGLKPEYGQSRLDLVPSPLRRQTSSLRIRQTFRVPLEPGPASSSPTMSGDISTF